MTSAQQTQYYSFLERQRRLALYHQSLTSNNILVIKDAIINGINPAEDPDLSAEFWRLIDEFGTSLFASELLGLNLTFEDGTLVPIQNEAK